VKPLNQNGVLDEVRRALGAKHNRDAGSSRALCRTEHSKLMWVSWSRVSPRKPLPSARRCIACPTNFSLSPVVERTLRRNRSTN